MKHEWTMNSETQDAVCKRCGAFWDGMNRDYECEGLLPAAEAPETPVGG